MQQSSLSNVIIMIWLILEVRAGITLLTKSLFMRYLKVSFIFAFVILLASCSKEDAPGPVSGDGFIIDHTSTKLAQIPSEWSDAAK